MTLDHALLDSLRTVGDPVADEVIAQLFEQNRVTDANALFAQLKHNAQQPPTDHPASLLLADYFAMTAELPPFLDAALVARASEFFRSHGPSILTVLGAYSLPLDYAAKKGVQVLARTARMTKNPNRRVVETAQLLTDVLHENGLSPDGAGIRTVQKVRLIHAAVRYLIVNRDSTWSPDYGTPINQEDMLGTLLSFSVAVLDGLQRLDMPATADEADAYYHCFRVVGYLLGIAPHLIPDNLADAAALSEVIFARQAGVSPEGREMTAALLSMMDAVYPWPLQGTGAALMRHLLGDTTAELLAIPRVSFSQRQIVRLQQFFYASLEDAADESAVMRRLRRVISHWYLSHITSIDRGPGQPTLQLPQELGDTWRANHPPSSQPRVVIVRPPSRSSIPQPVPLRSINHPVKRNDQITQSYHLFSQAMVPLFGEPAIADWCTYAKFASRQAGVHIRETSVTARDFMQALFDRTDPGKLRRMADDLWRLPDSMAMARVLLELCLSRVDGSLTLGDVRKSGGSRIILALADFRACAARLNQVFHQGNQRVYENIAPAYFAYLRAAQIAPNGVPSEVPSIDEKVDPHGYLHRGFSCYREAQLASLRGDIEARDRLVLHGSLWIGIQEQSFILQPLFDQVRPELAALSRCIVVIDPRGEHVMLPAGGDWGEFFHRLGIDHRRVGPQPFVTLPPLLSGDALIGTIAGYFCEGLHSQSLINGRPSEVLPMGKLGHEDLLAEERAL